MIAGDIEARMVNWHNLMQLRDKIASREQAGPMTDVDREDNEGPKGT